ncbi:MAG: hypothetical protein KGJ13_09925 [Patescibacteria group bacterium]|nr:hypothetical protein [Patescibacteria group bacterium]
MNPHYLNAIRAACDNMEADPSPSNVLMQTATITYSSNALAQSASDELIHARSAKLADTMVDIVRTAAGQ